LPDNTSFFVGWGTLSLINAGLAQAKGRSGLVWWIVSLVLGPVATLLIVVLPPVPPVLFPSLTPKVWPLTLPLPVRRAHSTRAERTTRRLRLAQ